MRPIAEAAANPQVLEQPPFNIGYLWMNQDKPFTDERVRQAVGMCLDREAIVQPFYTPFSQVAEQFIPRKPGLYRGTSLIRP
jgi:ABC-type transport system substrate-binding protein